MDANTVQFNVGGTLYRVSRSLLEQYPNTMLSRLVSDTWRPGGNSDADTNHEDTAALFIERSGERFQYVLDFMRDGGAVDLPPTTAKNALLRDLEYFGFDNIDPSKIVEKGSLPLLKICHKQIDYFIEECGYMDLVKKCLRIYKQSSSLTPIMPNYKSNFPNGFDPTRFNECLKRFGLKLDSKQQPSDSRIFLEYL